MPDNFDSSKFNWDDDATSAESKKPDNNLGPNIMKAGQAITAAGCAMTIIAFMLIGGLLLFFTLIS